MISDLKEGHLLNEHKKYFRCQKKNILVMTIADYIVKKARRRVVKSRPRLEKVGMGQCHGYAQHT